MSTPTTWTDTAEYRQELNDEEAYNQTKARCGCSPVCCYCHDEEKAQN